MTSRRKSENVRLTVHVEHREALANAVINSDAPEDLKAHVWAWLHNDTRAHR